MQAIILKKSPFAEGNEIITMYSRELGKVRGVARSVKLIKSKLAFGLQTLFYSEVEIAGASKMPVITGVRVLEHFKNLRENHKLVNYALFATELVLKSTADEQPNAELFDYFLDFLKHLSDSDKITKHVCIDCFIFRIMTLTGYEVQFDKCIICANKLNPEDKIYFSNRKSGFICTQCNPKISDSKALSKNTYLFLETCSHQNFSEADSLQPSSDAHAIAESFAVHILERDLKSGRFIV